MADVVSLTALLSDSVYTPMFEIDPAYIKMQGNVGKILEQVVKETGYTIATLPPELESYVILLAQKHLFRTLSVIVAPEYNVESEFTKIAKGDRFSHYFKLLEDIQKEINEAVKSGKTSVLQSVNAILESRNGGKRNYELSSSQEGKITTSNITSSSVDIDWSIFDLFKGGFLGYEIHLGTVPLFDPYEDDIVKREIAEQSFYFFDIKKSKLRIKELLPATLYHLAVSYRGTSGTFDTFTTSFTTL